MDFDSRKVKRCTRALKEIDFELAYLALLTREVLKPLSRWEKPLDAKGLKLLEEMGLVTRQVRRTVKTGKEVIETIFSTSAGYVQLYEKRFGDKPIDKSAQTQRLEGFLFGFPPCCVDEYIRHPYIKNGLAPQDQKILFHWACVDCKITALLLGAYKKVHNFLANC